MPAGQIQRLDHYPNPNPTVSIWTPALKGGRYSLIPPTIHSYGGIMCLLKSQPLIIDSMRALRLVSRASDEGRYIAPRPMPVLPIISSSIFLSFVHSIR